MRIEMSDVHDIDMMNFLEEFIRNIKISQTPIAAMNEALETSDVCWKLLEVDDSSEIYVVRNN